MPATLAQISRALAKHRQEPGVCSLIRWQFGWHTSSFYQALWQAIQYADEKNLQRLRCGFPAEVDAYHQWAYGDLAEELRQEGLEI